MFCRKNTRGILKIFFVIFNNYVNKYITKLSFGYLCGTIHLQVCKQLFFIYNYIWLSSYFSTIQPMTFLIALIVSISALVLCILIYRLILLSIVKAHRYRQASKITFLQVKIPKKEREEIGEADAHQQSMKQNIEVMNQIYKNFYAVYNDKRRYRWFGNNYISMELFIEKEMIKFIV